MPHQTWRRRARNREGTGVARRHVGGRLGAPPMLFVGRDMRGERRVGPSIQTRLSTAISSIIFNCAMEMSWETSLL